MASDFHKYCVIGFFDGFMEKMLIDESFAFKYCYLPECIVKFKYCPHCGKDLEETWKALVL